MNLIQLGRGQGKTRFMVDWLCGGGPVPGHPDAWNRAVVVCTAERQEWLTEQVHRRYPLPTSDDRTVLRERERVIRSIYTIGDFLSGRTRSMGVRGVEIGVDDLDDVLAMIFRTSVSVATSTPPERRSRKN